MNRKLIVAILAVTLICAFAGAGTMAYFTSRATSRNNTFVAGSLILGGIIDEEEVQNRFATLSLENLKPGEPVHVGSTILKNVGSLLFKLYRMTASNIQDESGLDDVLNIIVKIGGEQVFTGKLSQLAEENGGYFDPIYGIQPGDEKQMEITIMMDAAAGNAYQGKSMTCDLTVYAAQEEMTLQGQPSGTRINFGTAPGGRPTFSVEGYEEGGWLCFDWDWDPSDDGWLSEREYYQIDIKHETGDPTTNVCEARVRWWIFVNEGERVISVDGIDENDVRVDWSSDIVKIRRSAFPSDWELIEVKLSGTQNISWDEVDDVRNGEIPDSVKTIPGYQPWYF